MNDQIITKMEVIPIHKVPHLLNQCCNLLNMEWKRSEVARLRSLTVSCDELPTCLVLVHNENNATQVLGHSKITRIPTVPEGCFVESVVIHPDFRRKGLGKYLMIKTEDYAKSRGFSCMFLSTHDQEIFYGKLGYSLCPPVSIYGSAIPKNENKGVEITKGYNAKVVDAQSSLAKMKSYSNNSSTNLPPPPPPPPPMPNSVNANVPKKVFMNKYLF